MSREDRSGYDVIILKMLLNFTIVGREDKTKQDGYDPTTGYILTPHGWGKFVSWNPATRKVTVELDHMYLVELDGDRCYVPKESM